MSIILWTEQAYNNCEVLERKILVDNEPVGKVIETLQAMTEGLINPVVSAEYEDGAHGGIGSGFITVSGLIKDPTIKVAWEKKYEDSAERSRQARIQHAREILAREGAL
jgi:hypothetical protein